MLGRVIGLFSPGRVILAATLVAIAYLLLAAGGHFLDSYRLADSEAQLQVQVDELHDQEAQLTQIRDYLRSDDYIEFMARRVFGLVKPGETLVIVQAPPDDTPPEDPAGRLWWERLFGR